MRERNRLQENEYQPKSLSSLTSSSRVGSVIFSTDGNTIASVRDDGVIKLWNKHGQLLQIIKTDDREITNISLNPNANSIASVIHGGVIKLLINSFQLRLYSQLFQMIVSTGIYCLMIRCDGIFYTFIDFEIKL